MNTRPIYVLVCREDDGSIVRVSTAQHTQAGRESLEKQLRHYNRSAWVQTEWERTA